MSCPTPERFAAWIDAEVSREEAERLSAHVRQCVGCAARARQLRVLTQDLARLSLAPPAPAFARQLEASLTAQAQAARPRVPLRTLAIAASFAAIGLVYLAQRGPSDAGPAGTLLARGGLPQGAALGFEVYVHEPDSEETPLREGQRIDASAGYSFVVSNRSRQRQYLMLFALDARDEAHWFYPAFVAATDDPRSIALPAAPQVQALPEGVTPQQPALGPFRFVGVFTSAPLSVQNVEVLLRAGGVRALSNAYPGAQIDVRRAELHRGGGGR